MAAGGVLFDVDGTLVDSSFLHTLAWSRAFREIGENPTMASIHRHIGMGSDQLVSALIGREDASLSDRHSRHLAPLREEMRAFPRAGDLLREVHRRGIRVVLATSAKEEDLPVLLREIAADDAIDEVVFSKDAERSKPAPDIFQVALDRIGIPPAQALAVGDSVWDVKAARRAGLRCVCLCSGGVSRGELEEAGAIAVYDDAGALLEQLDGSPIASLAESRL